MRRIHGLSFMAIIMTLAIGCGKQEEKKPAGNGDAASTEVGETAKSVDIPAEAQAEVEAKLAEADALDGTTDKVVHRCASCSLGMDGKPEIALEVAGYTLHFCSEHCKEGFAEDITKSVLELKIPENGPDPT